MKAERLREAFLFLGSANAGGGARALTGTSMIDWLGEMPEGLPGALASGRSALLQAGTTTEHD